MWSVRAVVESVVEHGRRVLQQVPRRPLTRAQQHPSRPFQAPHNLNKCQSGGGAGAGRQVAESVGEQANGSLCGSSTSPGAGGVVSRLGPATARLVQGFVRKVSAPLWTEARRRATKRLVFGESAPYFALVGVTLVSGSQQGLVTKEDELEALCCNIREAISRAGWLHNPEYWQHYQEPTHPVQEDPPHAFSLADFTLGSVIDKGCNAVVYAAKWATDGIKDEDVDASPSKQARPSSSGLEEDGFEEQDQVAHTGLTEELDLSSSSVEADLDTQEHNSSPPSPAVSFRAGGSQEEVECRRVRFKEEERMTGVEERKPRQLLSEEAAATRPPHDPDGGGASMKEFPLAVKMMFNYDAESNAPAIIRAMYKELLPARSLQLDDPQLEWQARFCDGERHLPPHPNIVEMPCVFVDRVPLLEDSMNLYPNALPARLNPSGYGRNMSMFCVMKRYEMSLREYLSTHRPSEHTSLLLLTQLLEAVLHINSHNVAHRDLKSDNILLSLTEGWQYPQLVLADFGCSVATDNSNISVPFPSREADPRQGNPALMAPEVKTATPGFLCSISFCQSDLWAVGALAYEVYGLDNPFCVNHQDASRRKQRMLDSATYKESQLPRLPKSVPASVKHLVHALLHRNPRNRPSANIAATFCQLLLWAPSKWLSRHSLTMPTHTEIMQWLLCLTTKVLCEAQLCYSPNNVGGCGTPHRRGAESRSERQGGQLEYEVVSTFLARVHYVDIIQAIKWNRAF